MYNYEVTSYLFHGFVQFIRCFSLSHLFMRFRQRIRQFGGRSNVYFLQVSTTPPWSLWILHPHGATKLSGCSWTTSWGYQKKTHFERKQSLIGPTKGRRTETIATRVGSPTHYVRPTSGPTFRTGIVLNEGPTQGRPKADVRNAQKKYMNKYIWYVYIYIYGLYIVGPPRPVPSPCDALSWSPNKKSANIQSSTK